MSDRTMDERGTNNRGTDTGFRATGLVSYRGTGPATTDPKKFTLYFEKARHELKTPEQIAPIEQAADLLHRQPFTLARIVGHASTEGDSDYNLNLSARRADTVAQQLQRLGIKDSRLVVESVGERIPAVREAGDESRRALNRRVEITIELKAPAGMTAQAQGYFERQLRLTKEAIQILEDRRSKYEGYLKDILDRAKREPNLGGPGDLIDEIDELTDRIDMLRGQTETIETAILEGAPKERFFELDRQRQNAYRDSAARAKQRIQRLEKRLAEAKADRAKATSADQIRFLTETVEYFEFQIDVAKDYLATIEKAQELEKKFLEQQRQESETAR